MSIQIQEIGFSWDAAGPEWDFRNRSLSPPGAVQFRLCLSSRLPGICLPLCPISVPLWGWGAVILHCFLACPWSTRASPVSILHKFVSPLHHCLVSQFSSVQSLSRVQLFSTPWTATHQASLSITNSQSLLILMSIELVMPSNHLILYCPLLLPPSIFPSIRVFSNESVLCIRWPKYWSFSFSISLPNEHPVLISFRMDWLDLLAVQGTLKSLLQHHSSKASILWCSALFIVQLSHLYMTTGKNHSFD